MLVDDGAQRQLGDILTPQSAAVFRASPGDPNLGITSAALWLRFDFDVRPGGEGRWLIELAYPPLDRIELFHGERHVVAGDRLAVSERPFPHRNHVLPVDLTTGPHTVFLRITTQSNLTAPLMLWRPEALHLNDQRQYTLYSIYIGALLALLAYNLLLYFSLHESVYLAYVAYVALMTLGQVGLNGIGGQFLWPEALAWGNIAAMTGIAGAGVAGIIFTRLFLSTPRTMPRLDKALTISAVSFGIAVLASPLGRYDLALNITSLMAIAFMLLVFAGGIIGIRQGHSGARYFLLAWSMLLGGGSITALRNIGILPANWLTLNSLQIGSTLELLLLSFALADRIHAERRAREQAQAEALVAREASIATLQRSERELEERVQTRTAELKEANARLIESERQQRMLAQHDPLTGLPNRILLQDRIQQAILRCKRSGERFALLLIDLDDFKPINDAHGHAIGDEVLKIVAHRLRSSTRSSDTVARLGGDEFVVLLDGLDGENEITGISGKIIEALQAGIEQDGLQLQTSASVGIAIFGLHGHDSVELMRSADDAMYQAKQAGRGCYRIAGSPIA